MGTALRFDAVCLFFVTLLISACSQSGNGSNPNDQVFKDEHSTNDKSAVSANLKKAGKTKDGRVSPGKGRLGILYYLDQPANRQLVLDWLETAKAKITFESKQFGYIDAELNWQDLDPLIKKAVEQSLDKKLFFHLEFENESSDEDDNAKKAIAVSPLTEPENTSFRGPAHNAGYGANVSQFREHVASELGLQKDDIAGQGVTVAIFDSGLDLSRTDVYQTRIKDFLVAETDLYKDADKTLDDLKKAKFATTGLEPELNDEKIKETLKFIEIKNDDGLNGAAVKKQSLWLAIFKTNDAWNVKVSPSKDAGFGDAILDFHAAYEQKKPQVINLLTGKYLVRDGMNRPNSAAGFKIREKDGTLQVAMVGTKVGSQHGIANLSMVGGNYQSGSDVYQGVAPQVDFLAMATWGKNDYGNKWIPLARAILQAVEAGADVLDLDIYAPGTRDSNDLLSDLLCRITRTTNVVPVIASHNYGPLPDTIQNMAQSPCVLGIGASHTVAALREAFGDPAIDPALTLDAMPQTAYYSGRGFGMNGLLKPDIISPAYGYTAYGSQFIRFNGTSGATPTTAGSIALLKQAAKINGTQLNLSQVRSLFQGASAPVEKEHLRDGYGFLNLDGAWNLFKSSSKEDLRPIEFSGYQRFALEGKPQHTVLSATIVRKPVVGDADQSVPMEFWVEYSDEGDASWLKFNDTAHKDLTVTLQKDMPSFGNSTSLRLSIDIDDKAWGEMAAGEHIAIVKGIRSSLKNKSRGSDFAMPIVIVKPLEVDETTIETKPLWSDQYQVLNFATTPGEKLFLSSQFDCQGTELPSAINDKRPSAPYFVVQNENATTYPHASTVMNTYGPALLSSSSIAITAHDTLTRVALVRESMARCDGAMKGHLVVRRTGFKIETPAMNFNRKDGSVQFALTAPVKLSSRAGALMPEEFNRGTTYSFKVEKATWIFRKKVLADTTLSVPKGTSYVRVVPDNPQQFEGILAEVNKDGKTVATSSTVSAMLGQFNSSVSTLNGDYLGAELTKPKPANTVYYYPAASGDKFPATLQIEVPGPETDKVALKGQLSSSISRWERDETKTMDLTGTINPSSDSNLKAFDPNEWSTELKLYLSVSEQLVNGAEDEVESVGMKIWRGAVSLPLNR
jgi:subtilisin family serine protease